MTHLDAPGSFAAAASAPAGAAEAYAATKWAKYGGAASNAEVLFKPCVFDTHGACAKEGLEVLRLVARAWGRQFDLAPCRSTPLIFQRVSFTVMKGVARLLLANARPLAAGPPPANKHTGAPPTQPVSLPPPLETGGVVDDAVAIDDGDDAVAAAAGQLREPPGGHRRSADAADDEAAADDSVAGSPAVARNRVAAGPAA